MMTQQLWDVMDAVIGITLNVQKNLEQKYLSFKRLSQLKKWYCTKECQAQQDVKVNEILILIRELKDSIQYTSDQYKDLKDESDVMKTEIQVLKDENEKQHKEMQIIKSPLNVIRQEGLNKTLICFGIKHDTKENVLQLVIKEFSERGIPTDGIVIARRKQQNKLNTNIPPITISFANEDYKRQTWEAAKTYMKNKKQKNSPSDTDVATSSATSLTSSTDNTGDTTKVVNKFAVRELLTDLNYQLFNETKAALKSSHKYIWTKNGRIFTKKRRR